MPDEGEWPVSQLEEVKRAIGANQDESRDRDSVSRYQRHHDFYVDRWDAGELEEADLPQLFLAIWREQQRIVAPIEKI